jgi:hypothetical protein
VSVTWPNFWETELGGVFVMRSQNLRLTRGGPSMEQPQRWETNIEVQSSEAAQTRGEASLTYGRNEDGGLTFEVDSELTLQPDRSGIINPRLRTPGRYAGDATTLAGGPAATFGAACLRTSTGDHSTQVRLNTPSSPTTLTSMASCFRPASV